MKTNFCSGLHPRLWAICCCWLALAAAAMAYPPYAKNITKYLYSGHPPLIFLMEDLNYNYDVSTGVIAIGTPAHGTATPASEPYDGIVYTPGPDFPGSDTFAFTLSDGAGNTSSGTARVADARMLIHGTFIGPVVFEKYDHYSDTVIGAMRVTFGDDGLYSGAVTAHSKKTSLLGRMNTDGSAYPGDISFYMDPFAQVLYSVLAAHGYSDYDGNYTEIDRTFVEGKAAFSGANPCLLAGAYTFSVGSRIVTGRPPNAHFGDGYGRMVVSASGSARISAYLADGGSLSTGSAVLGDYIPFATNVHYSGYVDGNCTGQFSVGDGPSICDWKRVLRRAGAPYVKADGYEVIGAVTYSKYNPRSPALNLVYGSGNTDLRLTENGRTLTQTMTWAEENVTAAAGASIPVTVKVNTQTGVFSGTFLDPILKQPSIIGGVVLQHQNSAAGFFHARDHTQSASGGFYLMPHPAGN